MKKLVINCLNVCSRFSLLLILLGIILLHMVILAKTLGIYNNSDKLATKKKLNFEVLYFLQQDTRNIPYETLLRIIRDANYHQVHIGDSRLLISLSSEPKFNEEFNPTKANKEKLISHLAMNNMLSVPLNRNLWINYQLVPIYNFSKILIYLIIFDFLLLSSYFFYIFTLHRFKVPLKNFKESAEKLGIDLNTPPVKVFGPKLVQETADVINKLQARIKDLILSRTQMLAAISHDLRTSITRLKLRSEFLPASSHVRKMYDELTEMELMIEGVLNFAGEDMLKEKKKNFDIVVLIFSICEELMDQEYAVHVETNKNNAAFFGRRLSFKRTFTNLIQNAIKYAGEVWVKIYCSTNTIQIFILDNGPGISEVELPKVFQPFYRSAEAREKHVGFGLGLTIAYEVIRVHGGTLTLRNREQGGLEVNIVLPIEKMFINNSSTT